MDPATEDHRKSVLRVAAAPLHDVPQGKWRPVHDAYSQVAPANGGFEETDRAIWMTGGSNPALHRQPADQLGWVESGPSIIPASVARNP